MDTSKIKVMLVDDHAVVREGYRRLIEKQGDMIVVGEAADGASAQALQKTVHADVIILDISMPGQGGLEVIRRVRQRDDATRILVFTMHQNVSFAIKAFEAGANGYITKGSPPNLLINAIRSLMNGGRAISPDISEALAQSRISGDSSIVEKLSSREFEILRMIAEARSTQEIAETLNLSTKTVLNYHYSIKSKLGVATDIELVHLALSAGIIQMT